MTRVRSSVVAVVVALASALPAAQGAVSKKEAALVEQKVNAVAVRGAAPAARRTAAKPVSTVFTEHELNIYLQANGKELLPEGVRDPRITIAGDRRVSGRAIVDLDAVRKSKERGWLDPASYLTGSVEVQATGVLQTADGKGTFVLESATVGSVPVPKSLLQELVSYYSKSPETPDGVNIDKPFELPANIREVQIQRGAATVIQ